MEEEEKEAQSAKLQELIRRGQPEDLQEANRLMKIMSGFDNRTKTDYRAKAAEEVAKIQAKARLLEERLDAFQPGDSMHDGDVFSELASALQSAQPKIQKMCEEESDDHEAVAKLLEINDSIHRTAERYKLIKKGDFEGAKAVAAGAPPPTESASSASAAAAATGKSAMQELSLIDFGGEGDANGASSSSQPASQSAGGVENDLLGLSIGESENYGSGGALSLGFGSNQSTNTSCPHASDAGLTLTNFSDVPGPALLSSMTENSNAGAAAPASGPSSAAPPFSQFASFTSPSASQSGTPQPPGSAAFQPPQQTQQQQQPAAADPFAALGASTLTPSKPSTPAPASSAFSTTPAPAAAPAPAASTNNDDDEWSFSSALPPEAPSLPREHRSVVGNGGVKIELLGNRSPASPNALALHFAFSNNTAQPISELHYQLAVTKVSGPCDTRN